MTERTRPMSPDAAQALVLRNAPTSETYAEDSFVHRLFEEARFDAGACRALEAALRTLVDAPALAAQTDRHVFAIYRLVALKLLSHLNPQDTACVDNLDDDAVIDLRNRVDFVVGCYFFREPFDLDDWWRAWLPGVPGAGPA